MYWYREILFDKRIIIYYFCSAFVKDLGSVGVQPKKDNIKSDYASKRI